LFAPPVIILMIVTTVHAAGANPDRVTTYWVGTTQARCGPQITEHNRCGAVQNITLTLVQEGTNISGSYTCAFGNLNCRGMQRVGDITRGSLRGRQLEFRVMAPDRTVCRFSGLLEQDSGRGSYTCRGGSHLAERGTWRIQRSTEKPTAPREPSLLRP
jgi:hypothetical protein